MTGSATVHPFVSAEGWQAIGSIATAFAAFVAAGAVIVAILQLRDARTAGREQMDLDKQTAADQLLQAQETALDQARPYVLLTAERSEIGRGLLWELVLQNVGSGPAHDVEITVEPPFRRAGELPGQGEVARIFARPVPLIPPHYRSATILDSEFARSDEPGLPPEHDVTISYSDGRGHTWTETSVIDLTVFQGLLLADKLGPHHAAQALEEIQKLLKGSKLLKNGSLDVVVETPGEKQARIEAAHRRHDDMIAMIGAREAAEAAAAADTSTPTPDSGAQP